MPCCNCSNDMYLCQPDTGIARVVVDIVNNSDPISSEWCKAGVGLDSFIDLALNDICPSDGQPKYCRVKIDSELTSRIASTYAPFTDLNTNFSSERSREEGTIKMFL